MRRFLGAKLMEVLAATAPLLSAVCVLQVALVHAPPALFLRFLLGALLAAVGMFLIFVGIDVGILPMGRFIGAELPRRSLRFILAVAFSIGFAITIAEPDVLVLAHQVDAASNATLRWRPVATVIALGVGLFVALAMLRVVHGFSMKALLAGAYAAVIVLSFLAPAELVPLAYDAGSVTTGVLTTPVVISLALGLTSVLGGRSGVADSFGFLGLASIGPIIAILLAGMLAS